MGVRDGGREGKNSTYRCRAKLLSLNIPPPPLRPQSLRPYEHRLGADLWLEMEPPTSLHWTTARHCRHRQRCKRCPIQSEKRIWLGSPTVLDLHAEVLLSCWFHSHRCCQCCQQHQALIRVFRCMAEHTGTAYL